MMNARNTAQDGAGNEELERELQRILSSSHFAKAHSGRRMLRFLIDQVKTGMLNEMGEYTIGLAVFSRDPKIYSTGDDPIVRVQAGRLRQRLKAYYDAEGNASPLRISIPVGSYRPRVDHAARVTAPARLILLPLVCIGEEAFAQHFALGLHEELSFRLHHDFGPRVASGARDRDSFSQLRQRSISHVLEGSVRQNGDGVRTVFRLLDLDRDCVSWSDQRDHDLDLSVACQERVALACCAALHRHFTGGRDDGAAG